MKTSFHPLPILVSWSGGKDCLLALAALRQDPRFQVIGLISSFCRSTNRLPIHEVRRELIQDQAAALGLPLQEVELGDHPSNVEYEQAWSQFYRKCRETGIRHVAFGDLFLTEIRTYREQFLATLGIEAVFPLWGRPTLELAHSAVDGGMRAVVCSCDPNRLDRRFAGRLYNRQLISELPADCDPCGENGEFHTFVFDGPEFSRPVSWAAGEIQHRQSVDFCDLLPVQITSP